MSARVSLFIFASTWKSNWPAAVGVPEIRPVFASSARPGGSVPELIVQRLRVGHGRRHLQRVRRTSRPRGRRLGPDRELCESGIDVDPERVVRRVLERASLLPVVRDDEDRSRMLPAAVGVPSIGAASELTLRPGGRPPELTCVDGAALVLVAEELDRDRVRDAFSARSGRCRVSRPCSPFAARRSCRRAPTTRARGTSRPRSRRGRGGASVPPAGQGSRHVRRSRRAVRRLQARRAPRRRRASRLPRTPRSPRSSRALHDVSIRPRPHGTFRARALRTAPLPGSARGSSRS